MSTFPPPSPTEPPTTATTATTFPPPTGAQILRALRAPAVGYAWLLLGAVVTTVLILVAANIGSTRAETGVGASDTNSIGVLVGMPFQAAGMALLGSLGFTSDGVRASLFLPPLVLTALYLVMTVRAARGGDVLPAAGTRALLGVIVGFVGAVLVTLLTRGLAMRADGVAVHAASVSLFFGVWALTGLASYVGTTRTVGFVRPSWIPGDYASAARLWLGSVAVWLVAAFVVLTAYAAFRVDLWVGLLSPVWGPTVGLYTYAIGHLGGLSLGGESVNIGDLGALWTITLIVTTLALAVVTSVAWHLRRDRRDATLATPGSWAVLPATYAVGGLLVWWVPTVMLGGELGVLGGSVTLQPAFWSVFVLIGWGGAVEALSRFVAPSLVPVLPPRVHAVLRGPDRRETTPTAATLSPAAAGPLTPEERARYKRIGILSGAVVAVGLAGWVAVSIANSQLYGPEKRVAAYLDAVVAGDLDTANDLAPTDDELDDGLLTSAVYRAAETRITGYEIGDVVEDGDSVTAQVQLEGLGGGVVDAEVTMKNDGRTAGVFDDWRVADGGLAKPVTVSVPDGAGDLTVNDVAVDRPDDDVWLLPGDYVFDAFAGNPWLESSGDPVTVVADEDYQYAEVPSAVASEAFVEEVRSQIEAYVTACMASTELEPAECPNGGYAGTDVRNVVWTLDQAPEANFDGFDGTFPADLSYGDSGAATVTYEADQSYGFGPPDWQAQTEQADLYLDSISVTQDGDDLVVSIGG